MNQAVTACKVVLFTLDVNKLLLGQRLAVNGIGSILGDVLLDEAAFKHLVGNRRDARVLRYLV